MPHITSCVCGYKFVSKLIIVVFVATLIGSPISAQTAVLSAAASTKVLSDFIDDARASAEQLLLSGEVVADRQIRNAANQMLVVTRELELALADQLDKTVSDLDETVKASLGQVEGMQLALENGTTDLTDAFDDLSLDVAEILGGTILAKHSFVLKRIEGVAQLYRKNENYVVNLLGSSFGSSRVELTKVSLNALDVTNDVLQNAKSQHRVSLTIPKEQLNSLFDLNENPLEQVIKTVPLELSLTRFSDAPFWRIWNRDEDQKGIVHTVHMYLIPPVAGSVDLSYLGESFDWVETGVFEFVHTSAGNHCQGDCDTDDRGDWPISQHGASTIEQRCVTQRRATPLREGDEYLYSALHKGGPSYNAATVNIIEGGHCLFFNVSSRTHAHTYTVQASKRTYLKLPDPVELGAESISVAFGQTYRITAPENTISTLFSFDPLGTVLPQTGELNPSVNNEALRVVSSQVIGAKQVITFTVKYPELN